MAKKRITESQVKKILQEVANGAKPPALAKKYGFSLGTYYNWKNKLGLPKPSGASEAAAAKPAPAKKTSAKRKPAKKTATKKAVAKKAPAKKAVAKKAAPKKATRKRAGRPPKARPSAELKLKAEIGKWEKQIATIEGRITRLKVKYAEAILRSVK